MRTTLYLCPAAALLLAFTSTSRMQAQTFTSTDGIVSPAQQRGVQPSSMALSSVESVNLYNGHLSVAIPLVAIGGRASAGYTMVLPIDTAFAVQNTSGTTAAIAASGQPCSRIRPARLPSNSRTAAARRVQTAARIPLAARL